MARRIGNFTDDEREALRKRLLAHKQRYKLSGQSISEQIADKTGFGISDEAGRRRVDRFLNAEHRQPADFVAAIADYLNQVAPQDLEDNALAFASLITQFYEEDADLSGLIGRYHAYLRPTRPAPISYPHDAGFVFTAPTNLEPQEFNIAYAIIAMTPLEKSNALLIGDTVTNITIDPDVSTFPEKSHPLVNTGVLVPFGFSRFLMVTGSLFESRLCHLAKIDENPVTLRGHMMLNSLQASPRRSFVLPLFDPDYEMKLVRIEDAPEEEQDGEDAGFRNADG